MRGKNKRKKRTHSKRSILVIVLSVSIIILLIYLLINLFGADDYEATNMSVIAQEDKSDKVIQLYIKNKETGEESDFETIDDVDFDHYHFMEQVKDNIYIIRKSEELKDSNRGYELWRYSKRKEKTKLYSAKNLDFRVSPTEEYIIIQVDNRLIFLDDNGNIQKEYSLNDLNIYEFESWIGLMKWSMDGEYLWGYIYNGPISDSLFSIDVKWWETKKYDIAKLPMYFDYDFNPNNKTLIYSDYPVLVDMDEYNRFKDSEKRVRLYIYNLGTKEQKYITTSRAQKFNPVWIDDKTVEFNNPNANNRIKYRLAY